MTAVMLVLALGGLASCGSEQGPDNAAPSSPAASPSETPSGSPSPDGSSEPGGSKTPGKGDTVELRGTVKSGVEAGCLLLTVDGKTYNLIGGDRDVVKSGTSVVVRGEEKPDMLTTCQQGVPFQVSEAHSQ
ncbi:MAG: hypothetical protein ACRDUA_20620 [Micromonosporaceae bacterium]